MGRPSAPRRLVAVLSTATGRWSRRSREVLLGKQDLPKSTTALDLRSTFPVGGQVDQIRLDCGA